MPTQPAVLGTARLNNFRLNYLPARLVKIREWRVLIFLDGDLVRCRVRRGSVTIHDVLNDAPNTCQFALDGAPAPEPGMAVRITLNTTTPRLLFNGTLETTALTYEGKPANVVYACSATDDTMRADNRRPFAFYQTVSATTVATDLVARFAPGLTATHVQAGLPTVTVAFDGTEGFNGCLRAICKIIGGYFYWEDGDLHLFLTEATEAPDPLTATTPTLLMEAPVSATTDESQLRTRVYGRGWGTTLLSDVLAGETVLPLANVALFTPGGGQLIASTTSDGSPTERFTYLGGTDTGQGTLVGLGVAPSVAPAATAIIGTGLGVGNYRYAYTFVTAAGESLPSPVAGVVTSSGVATPPDGITARHNINFGSFNAAFPIGEVHQYRYAYSTKVSLLDYSEVTLLNPTSVTITTVSNQDVHNPTKAAPLVVNVPYSADPRVKSIIVYQYTAAGGFVWRVGGSVANVTGTGIGWVEVAVTTTTNPVHSGTDTTAAARAVSLAGVALGPGGTTQRKVYRSLVNGTALKLQQTIANNTATTAVTDTTADGSLGAAAPATDTSGLTGGAVAGQVLPGATSILTTGTGSLPVDGWVVTPGNALIRYAAISGNTLTGIPASGPGAILTALPYGDMIVPVGALRGVTGAPAMAKGARVHIFVQRDDLAAQAAAAARESTATYTADGIHEHLLTDERRAEPSLTALCDADLQLFAYPLVTVQYVSQDTKTKSGKPITIALTSPPIADTLVIQDVTITQLDIADGVPARFATTASSVKFSLDDILRRLSALLPE